MSRLLPYVLIPLLAACDTDGLGQGPEALPSNEDTQDLREAIANLEWMQGELEAQQAELAAQQAEFAAAQRALQSTVDDVGMAVTENETDLVNYSNRLEDLETAPTPADWANELMLVSRSELDSAVDITRVWASEMDAEVKSDLTSFVTLEALAPYATKTDISAFITADALAPYATTVDISDFITPEALAPYATTADISDFITPDALAPYATKSWVADEDYAGSEEIDDVIALVEDAVALSEVLYVDGQGDVTLEGVNMRIVNGAGSTDSTNGKGNILVGYGAGSGNGSHNVVIGTSHNYTSYAGIIAGEGHTVSAPYAAAIAGSGHSVSGFGGSVTGGSNNQASGRYASITAGSSNGATGEFASICGGELNMANGVGASITGGRVNHADGYYSAILGGYDVCIYGDYETVPAR